MRTSNCAGCGHRYQQRSSIHLYCSRQCKNAKYARNKRERLLRPEPRPAPYTIDHKAIYAAYVALRERS